MLESTIENIDFERRKMFGQWALFHGGNMFAGVFEDDIFVRISLDDQDEVKNLSDEIYNFEPIKGKRMKEYLVLPPSIIDDKELFNSILRLAVNYVSKLPTK